MKKFTILCLFAVSLLGCKEKTEATQIDQTADTDEVVVDTVNLPDSAVADTARVATPDQPQKTAAKPAVPVNKPTLPGKPAAPLFACPMHPEVTGTKGQDCSKCGMALTELVK